MADMCENLLHVVRTCVLLLLAQLSHPSPASSSNYSVSLCRRAREQTTCLHSEFTCSSGECIPSYSVCDEVKDCSDGSDEIGTVCRARNSRAVEPPTYYKGCYLPEQPEHGKYDFPLCERYGTKGDGCNSKPNTLVPHNWLLKYHCDANYQLPSESKYSLCDDGVWKNTLDCITLCPPLESLSVELRCFLNGQEVSCSKAVRVNTMAFAKCKSYYKELHKPKYSSLLCQDNGNWSNQLFQCEPECGSPAPLSIVPLIAGGKAVSNGEFPWLVAIYGKFMNKWEHELCGGTLISPHVVVTAAHCLSFINGTAKTPESFKVGLGKHSRDYYKSELFSVIADVREVVLPRLYSGGDGSYAVDIALLDLAARVEMTRFIMPACIDWANTLTINNGDVGHIGGWGYTEFQKSSEEVMSATLSYVDTLTCIKTVRRSYQRHITHDKFCGSSINGSQINKGDSGGGLTFVKNGKHYLFGVLSTRVADQNVTYALFTDVSNAGHHYWLQLQKNRLDMVDFETPISFPNEGRCELPEQPKNGVYVSVWCSNNEECQQSSNPGTPVDSGWLIKYSCNYSYGLTLDDSPYSVCENGVWKNRLDCVKMCPPLKSLSVDVRCSLSGQEVSCDKHMRPDTVATVQCKPNYVDVNKSENERLLYNDDRLWSHPLPDCRPVMCPPLWSLSVDVKCSFNGQDVPCYSPMSPNTTATAKCKRHYKQLYKPKYSSLLCQANGQWNHYLFSCTPECGLVSTTTVVPLIKDGVSATVGEFPWLTVIYLYQDIQWNQVCGGTLISPHLVVTAAHCLVLGDTRVAPEDLKVGLGKHYRDYYKEEPYSVISDVREIVIPRYYSGHYSNYALDIALLDLKASVQVTSYILPACVDWINAFSITPGTVGQVAGWGLTEAGISSSTLLTIELSYIDTVTCIKQLHKRNKGFVTHDKFCAENVNGSQLQPGDSGGGLTFVRDGQHFLFGVSSTKVEDEKPIALFTDIGKHEHRLWLGQQKDKLDKSHNDGCPVDSFQCNDGECQSLSVKCDGDLDCTDGSDEVGCPDVPTTQDLPAEPGTPALPRGNCRLPEQPKNGNYMSLCQATGNQSSACHNVPGTPVSQYWVLQFSCDKDYNLNIDNKYSLCVNGAWTPSLRCIKFCPPLKSLSVEVRCFFNGGEVPCDGPMRPNTTATAKCKEHYHQNYLPQDLYCQDFGEWNYKLLYCAPTCGVSTPPGTLVPLIQHASETKRGEFPWLAAIYHKNKSELWEQKCGSTLVTPHIILTAAHCVVVNGLVLQAENVKVGLGKYNRDYYTQENDSVIADVREIATPSRYSGPAEKYALDIALLDLKKSVQINTFVMPACVDWDSNFLSPVSFRTIGYVAGWGKTENKTSSDQILSTQLTFIDNVDCKKRFYTNLNYIVHDKFCAGSINGSQVLQGDSGGGFTVVSNRQHFVLGVVSAKVITGTEFSMFTEIKNAQHREWLIQKRNLFSNFHNGET